MPLKLVETMTDEPPHLSVLFYNAILIELRDMFRMLHAMVEKAKKDTLQVEDVTIYYEWFEGFFGILTSSFDTEEDVLFAWLEKEGTPTLGTALAPRRRETKKQRTKDLCWDIFDLKMQFEKKPQRSPGLVDLLKEICNESQQLSTRVLTYFQAGKDDLADVIDSSFSFNERRIIESSFMDNLRATEPGKFVICAVSRGFVDADQKTSFLEDTLRVGKVGRGTVNKQMRKFKKNHTDLADKLALDSLNFEISQTDDTDIM